jgi:hypothetical protein
VGILSSTCESNLKSNRKISAYPIRIVGYLWDEEVEFDLKVI